MTPRPTQALIRALLVGATTAVAAILLQRPALLLFSVPFLAYVLLALRCRPPTAELVRSPHAATRHVEAGARLTMGVATLEHDRDATTSTTRPGTTVGRHLAQAFGTAPVVVAVWQPVPDLDIETPAVLGVGAATTVVRPLRWGRYSVAPASITLSDPWGAFRAEATVAASGLFVVPRSAVLLGPDGISHPTGTAGAHPSGHVGDGGGLADLREFRPGDRIRRIDWHATARYGVPYVVTSYRDEDTDVLICVDTTSDLPGGPENPSSLDRSMSALTAITRYYAGLQDRISVRDLGAMLGSLKPGTGQRQVQRVVDMIGRADRGRWTARLRPVALRRIPSGTLTFFISTFLTADALTELLRLRRAGCDVIAVDVLGATGSNDLGGRFLDDEGFETEAAALTRLSRPALARSLRDHGIPLIAWEDERSLVTLMEIRRRARHGTTFAGGAP